MIKLLTLFLLINYVLSQSAACSEFSSSACTSSGYCYWTGSSCITAECHKVTDVSACRQTGVPATNGYLAAINKCFEIPSIDSNFLNQCMEQGQTTMMHAYVRFPIDLTQLYSSKTVNGYLVTTIMTAKYTSQYKNEILTVNILTATTGELLNIMNAYVQMQYDLADSAINQNYIEKAIYESMQAIRDDVQLTLTGIVMINFTILYNEQKIRLLHCFMENDRCILFKIEIKLIILYFQQIVNQFWVFKF